MPPSIPGLPPDASSHYARLHRRLSDLDSYQVPRLGECIGPTTLLHQFNAELGEDLRSVEAELETFKLSADEQERQSETDAVLEAARELQERLARVKREARSALLTSRRAIAARTGDQQRDELFRTAAQGRKDAGEGKSTDDRLMNATENVTEALRRTTALMTQELERSNLSTQMLSESTQTMRSLTTEYTTFSDLLTASKSLITALERADLLDRLLIMAALAFFLLVVAFVLKRRIVDRGLRIAFFWTRWLPGVGRAGKEQVGALTKMGAQGTLSTAVEDVAASVTQGALGAAQELAGSLGESLEYATGPATEGGETGGTVEDEWIHPDGTPFDSDRKTTEPLQHAEL